MKATGQVLEDLPGGEELPGFKGDVADAVEQASTRSLSDSRAGVEVWRFLIEEPSQEPRLTGAHDACKNSHHISHWQTAGLQSLVNDLLSSLISEGS